MPNQKFVFALLNLIFFASLFSTPVASLPILSFALLGYALLYAAKHLDGRWLLAILSLVLIAVFALLKKYTLVENFSPLSFAYSTVGLSYLLFRTLHLLIDVRQGAITNIPSPLAYFNYLFSFFTFIAGPIQRFQDHQSNLLAPISELSSEDIRRALLRILEGFIKVAIIAAVANDVAQSLPLSFESATDLRLSPFGNLPISIQTMFQSADGSTLIRITARFLLHAAGFLIYLYINFVGYMDIVIGAGALFGMRIPENFDRPFTARNLLEFWSRWHITLSNWFKFYVFNPLLKSMAVKWGGGAAGAYLAAPAFFITFALMGVWHGTTAAYWIYGFLLGGGVCINKLYQLAMQRRLGKKRYAQLSTNPLYTALSRGAMTAFFLLALACLWLDAAQLHQAYQLFGFDGLIYLYLLGALFSAFALSCWDWSIFIAAKSSRFFASSAFYSGFIILAAIWGNLLKSSTMLDMAFGYGILDPFKASIGALLILFAWEIRHRDNSLPAPGTTELALRLIMLVFVGLTHAGAVPDFVYKGF